MWPLIAVLSLVSVIVIFMLLIDDAILRLGNLIAWSGALFLATIFFAIATVASMIAFWRTPKGEIRNSIRVYSIVTIIALIIANAYLQYWGIIGLQTWN